MLKPQSYAGVYISPVFTCTRFIVSKLTLLCIETPLVFKYLGLLISTDVGEPNYNVVNLLEVGKVIPKVVFLTSILSNSVLFEKSNVPTT
jgi:hypothetical protein